MLWGTWGGAGALARAGGRGGGGGVRGSQHCCNGPVHPGSRACGRCPRRSASTPYWRVSRAQRAPNSLYTAHRGRLIEARSACLLLIGRPLRGDHNAVAKACIDPALSAALKLYSMEAVTYLACPTTIVAFYRYSVMYD